jgi:Sigma-70 region 2
MACSSRSKQSRSPPAWRFSLASKPLGGPPGREPARRQSSAAADEIVPHERGSAANDLADLNLLLIQINRAGASRADADPDRSARALPARAPGPLLSDARLGPFQEALLRAWRALDRFEGRSSLRSWHYTIATNVCLRTIERRAARVLPMDYGPPADPHLPLGPPVLESTSIQPYLSTWANAAGRLPARGLRPVRVSPSDGHHVPRPADRRAERVPRPRPRAIQAAHDRLSTSANTIRRVNEADRDDLLGLIRPSATTIPSVIGVTPCGAEAVCLPRWLSIGPLLELVRRSAR